MSSRTESTGRTAQFVCCIAGIYVCFLTWGVLQERISTVAYAPAAAYYGADGRLLRDGAPGGAAADGAFWTAAGDALRLLALYLHGAVAAALGCLLGAAPAASDGAARFDAFVFLNLCQSLGSALIAALVMRARTGAWPLCARPAAAAKFPPLGGELFAHYVRIALCFTLASPFGYASTKHIGYLTMSLGKTCKLIPLAIMTVLIRRQRLDRLKVFSILLITAGVTGFLLFEDKRKAAPASSSLFGAWLPYGNLYGILLLLANLLLDGAMNSLQDELYARYKVSSFHMMFHMNWISSVLMALYLLLFPCSAELHHALHYILARPLFLLDLLVFSLCGALGQAVIHYTIENFGSMSLVTVTVTRKLFTILLSVVYFGHELNLLQWFSVLTVFTALAIESFLGRRARGKLLEVRSRTLPSVQGLQPSEGVASMASFAVPNGHPPSSKED